MAHCGAPATAGARAMAGWTKLLRTQAFRAGMEVNDAVFGLAWSGAMTEDHLLRLIPALPDGLNEIYFHPAAARDALLDRLMPTYQHEAELAALCSPAVRSAFAAAGVALGGFSDHLAEPSATPAASPADTPAPPAPR